MYKKKRELQKEKTKKLEIRQKSPRNLLRQIDKVVHHYLSNLPNHIDNSYKDPRRKASTTYKLSEIILSVVYMYMMGSSSRNATNEDREYGNFKNNYKKIFKLKFPHMDTVNDVFEKLDEQIIEELKGHIIRILLKRRVLHKYKLLGKYFMIAIDGTGVFTYDKEPYKGCPYKESKTGKRTYYQNVVEAKIVTANGFSLSIASEWIINEDGKSKQDCEYNATMRLLEKLKKQYPRLPMCLLMDGLFAKAPIKKKILQNNWEYIIVWKEKTLYSLQDTIKELRKSNQLIKEQKQIYHNIRRRTEQNYELYTEALDNKGVKLYYISMEEQYIDITDADKNKKVYFMYMTSIKPDKANIQQLIKAGRMRWKIENEGFNTQKRKGFNLHHKMNRKNITAIKNYYNCLQIAHIINQLMILCKNSISGLWKTTIKMWQHFKAAMLMIIDYQPITNHKKYNFRY